MRADDHREPRTVGMEALSSLDGVFLAALVGNRSPADALHAACVAGARVAAGPEAWPVRP